MQKPNIRTIIIASVSLLLPAMALQAQNLSISGVVTDETGSPVIGAGIIVKGTTVGAATDIDGKFALSDVPADGTLTVSSIGYDPLEIEVNGKTSFNITLYTDSEMLEEVIMVGYGTQKKSDVTGSISSVTAESMENRSVSDVGQALQGKVAGLQILSTSGAPGASTSFRIRGYSSNGSSEPLYIVDGLKVTSIDYLDTESIDQIEVLKDAASAAIYGAEAGNGVVIISTKTAKNGDGRLFYNFQHSWQNIAGFPDVMNAEEYLEYQDLIGNTSVRSNWDGVTDTNWADEIFETGLMTRHTLGFQGGNDKASLFVSLSYNSHDGIVISDKDTFKRLTGQINASYKIKKWLQVQSNVSFEKATTKMVRHSSESGSAISSVLMHDPITPVVFDMDNLPAVVASRYEEGKPYLTDAAGNIYGVSLVCESQNYNPLIDIAQSDDRSERVNVNGTLQAMLTPFKNFIFTSRLGYRIGSVYESSYLYPFYVNELRSQSSEYLSGGSRQSLFYQWENFANYSFSLGNHEFALMAGMSYEEFNMKTIGADTYSLQSTEPNFRYLDYSTTDANDSVSGIENTNRSMSYFGRIGWSYKDRYNIMVNFRADAFDSSKLSRDSRWGFFPSVSGSWNVSNEPFFQQMDQNVLSFMKLRLSYGINGNVNALNSYAYASSMSTGNNYNLDGETLVTGIYPGTVLANPGLKWEESRQVDAGIDLRMFDDKLSFTMDFYRKTTDGLLVSTTPALSSGCSTVWKNAGQVLNRGFEFELGWKQHFGDFGYSISGNLSTVYNMVTVGPDTDRIAGALIQSASNVTYFEEGYPVWYIRGFEIDHIDSDGVPWYKTADGGASTSPDDNDKRMIGSAIPDFTYGVTFTANWKNLDLTVFGSGVQGNELYLAIKRGDYSTTNTINYFLDEAFRTLPGPQYQFTTSFLCSDGMVFDASYFKISQIQLGYTLPGRIINKVGLSSMRLYVSVEDAFTFTKYPGLDPQTRTNATSGMAVDRSAYPNSRRISIGANISF